MKKFLLLLMTTTITICSTIVSFAGEWKQDSTGWWYQNDNGSYPANSWQEINGKQYYFNETGYLLTSTTTPDGKQVDANGAMIGGPLFDIDGDTFHVTYKNYKLATSLYGSPCVVIFYDYTNKSDKDQSVAGSPFLMHPEQNGLRCNNNIISSSENIPEIESYFKHIKPGATIQVAEVFRISDNSPITLKLNNMYDLNDIELISTAVLNLQ